MYFHLVQDCIEFFLKLLFAFSSHLHGALYNAFYLLIWCCCWPRSTQSAFHFLKFFSICLQLLCFKVMVLMVGMEAITISFFRNSALILKASFLFYLVCFFVGTSVHVFLLVLRLRRAFNFVFFREIIWPVFCKISFVEFTSKIYAAFSVQCSHIRRVAMFVFFFWVRHFFGFFWWRLIFSLNFR